MKRNITLEEELLKNLEREKDEISITEEESDYLIELLRQKKEISDLKMPVEEAMEIIDCIIAKREIDDINITLTNEKDYDALRVAYKVLEVFYDGDN